MVARAPAPTWKVMHTARSRIGVRLADEHGFTLVELMAALSILAVGFLALAGAATTGSRLLAEGRQRQAASEIASRQLEHIRNVPYGSVALAVAPTHAADPDDPDHFLSNDGLNYDHEHSGAFEPLVIQAGGEVAHLESVTVGGTDLDVYHYVTWVDDPSIAGTQDYKRVVVVAAYHTPVSTGRPRSVSVSALLTTGDVVVAGTQSSGTLGSPTPTPTPTATPSPSPSGPCAGDTAGPTGTFTILSGTGAATGFTSSTTVTIQMAPSDACTPITARFSNDNVTYGTSVTYDAANPTATWVVTAGDGAKNVWVRYADGVGNTRTVGPQTITVDQTLPTVPGTLTRTVSCSGSDRTVTLSWGAATDTNLLGYRVYRSVDNGPFQILLTTTALSGSDTNKKTQDSIRYKVVAYDRAGNEGNPTNEIALAKNACS